MDRQEVDRRWMAREPVAGMAFLLGDSVQVVAGAHCGARGAVVSLAEASPPVYVVALGNGTEARLQQTDLVTATAEDPAAALTRLQRWYSSQCNGDWEHQLGVKVETLDNPGWLVKIDLKDTPLAKYDFADVRVEGEREWMDCTVQEGTFRGAGGPHMLGAILEVFVRWAEGGRAV